MKTELGITLPGNNGYLSSVNQSIRILIMDTSGDDWDPFVEVIPLEQCVGSTEPVVGTK